jgi:hypothetical protein
MTAEKTISEDEVAMNKWHRQYGFRGGDQKRRLFSGGKFEAKSDGLSYERSSGMCKTGALTAELTAPEQSYFSYKKRLCKIRGTLVFLVPMLTYLSHDTKPPEL